MLGTAIRVASSGAYLARWPSSSSLEYVRRFISWSPSGIQDWRRFDGRPIARPAVPFRFPERPEASARLPSLLREVTYPLDGVLRTVILDEVLAETGTTAFLIVQDGAVILERYLNGHQRDAPCRAFSVSKSFTSALVGIALAEGRIRDVEDPFVRYLPELAGRAYDGITLRHLLLMAGGLRFSHGRFPWTDSPLLYWHPDIRSLVRSGPPLVSNPGERFNYSDHSTAILGMVLERVAGTSISEYLERHLWSRVGAEYDALWSIDHRGDGLEQTPSGFNARAIDLVKLGVLYLDRGRWEGRQVLPEAWVAESVTPLAEELPGHSDREQAERVFYKYGWWGHPFGEGHTCYYAHGYCGQLVYVCPARRLVIARFGRETGGVGDGWPMLLRAVADRLG